MGQIQLHLECKMWSSRKCMIHNQGQQFRWFLSIQVSKELALNEGKKSSHNDYGSHLKIVFIIIN